MIRFKGCPRCGGDVRLDQDHYGWFEECLQCGYSRDVTSIKEFKTGVPKKQVRERVLIRRGG